jgi:hypothetical protein
MATSKPQVSEIKAGIGTLLRGTILATGSGADIGKLVLLTAGTEAQANGVLLDPSVDTSVAFGDGSVTDSIAKAGSFKGSALIVPAGVDAGLIAVALRSRGIEIILQVFHIDTVMSAVQPGLQIAEEECAGRGFRDGGTRDDTLSLRFWNTLSIDRYRFRFPVPHCATGSDEWKFHPPVRL